MKTSSSKILAISDPMQVAGSISVISKEGDQTYNPSASVFRPNRRITPTKLQAVVVGTDPNSNNPLEAKSAEWKVDGNTINNDNTDFVLSDDTLTLTVYQNGSINGGSITVQCTMYYLNSTSGKMEMILAEKVLTTTVHDTYQLILAPTTELNSLMNPMQDGATRLQDFGCKLVAGNTQVEANYYWYVRTINNGVPSDVKVTGTESWFKGSKYYTFETNDTNGEIIADSWELNDGGEIGTWATITVDVAKTDKLMLVCKAVPTYTGVDPQNKLQNNYQQVFRASMELPVLKKVKMHAIQGYTTKHNADVTATHFKAYVDIFVGSQELNGNDDNEKATIDEFFSVIWYKRINNKSTIIGYGATLDVTYQTLGITTTNVNGIDAINEATIPEIYAEVSENYISGGVQGAVYSNYETPNPKAVFGNDSIADELAAYLVETTYNEDDTTTIDAKRLMKNNWFRFENGQPAPTLLCTQAQYNTAMASTEYNNNGEQTYLGVPVDCYNPTGIDKNLDILYGWSEPVWTVEMHTNSSGEVVCYFAKEPFEIEEDGQVLKAVKIPPTLICPGLPTLHNGKFRTMFFLDGCGYGSNGTAGAGNIITTFNDAGKAWVATEISNKSNNTYSFAKNKDANNDNTPYAPLMHWHYNNILCVLETKFKSAILHDTTMFGAGISSNVPFTVGETSGVYTKDSDDKWIRALFSSTEDLYDASGQKHNWSEWLSNQGSRMICLEQQMFLSWAAENIKLEYKNNKGDGRCKWKVVGNKVIREENPYETFSSACARVFAGETIYISGVAASGSVYPYILADADMNFISGGTYNANITTNITIEQDGWLLVNRNTSTKTPAVVCIKRTTPPYGIQIPCKIIDKENVKTYRIYQSPKTIWDGEMSGKINVAHGISTRKFYDADGNNNIERYINAYCQISCVNGIDLVSADVFQCQNGVEQVLTMTNTASGSTDNKREVYICKDQTKLYRGSEIVTDGNFPFEEGHEDYTTYGYEKVGEAVRANNWGHDFLRGTCIPTEAGGGSSKISGWYTGSQYLSDPQEGKKYRMGFRGRGYAAYSVASARFVNAAYAVSTAAVHFAGGFQIRLPEKEVAE